MDVVIIIFRCHRCHRLSLWGLPPRPPPPKNIQSSFFFSAGGKGTGTFPAACWERTPCLCAAKPCFPCPYIRSITWFRLIILKIWIPSDKCFNFGENVCNIWNKTNACFNFAIRGAKGCKSDRSRKELSNKSLLLVLFSFTCKARLRYSRDWAPQCLGQRASWSHA